MANQQKNGNAWMLQGQVLQYVIDNFNLNGNEFLVFSLICRNSLGFKKRFCYMKYSDFKLAKATVSKALTSLQEKQLISVKGTYNKNVTGRGQNEYRILEPVKYINNFVFIGKENIKQKEQINEEVNSDRWD